MGHQQCAECGRGGGRTRFRGRARALRGARPPRRGPCVEPRAGGARTCPAPRGSADGRLHPPGASRTSPRERPRALLGHPRTGAARRRGRPCCAAAAAAAGSVVRSAAANLLRSLSRPLGSAGAASAPQQHGGRGLRRKPGGGEASDGRAVTARPPARPAARPRGTDSPPWGNATLRGVPPYLGSWGALDREGVGRSASLPATSRSPGADSPSRSHWDPPGSSSSRTLSVHQECQHLRYSVRPRGPPRAPIALSLQALMTQDRQNLDFSGSCLCNPTALGITSTGLHNFLPHSVN
ncbi:serine/arginine repetitive matrix protein 3-like [Mesocricetus auratus]|uniref:Serine/arginine repetitive matrix protein 3-like n=1 Tax=Mesocricetus auratus TaxID=10036 RepID=A0ABM2WD84_MESAU|nr:serine/arginine repetitive matrix protein 3-like [Mesocricetus auratus]